jgi:hypothetical protein
MHKMISTKGANYRYLIVTLNIRAVWIILISNLHLNKNSIFPANEIRVKHPNI